MEVICYNTAVEIPLKIIFEGHIHCPSMEYVNGISRFVAEDNARGAYLSIFLQPLEDRDSE